MAPWRHAHREGTVKREAESHLDGAAEEPLELFDDIGLLKKSLPVLSVRWPSLPRRTGAATTGS